MELVPREAAIWRQILNYFFWLIVLLVLLTGIVVWGAALNGMLYG